MDYQIVNKTLVKWYPSYEEAYEGMQKIRELNSLGDFTVWRHVGYTEFLLMDESLITFEIRKAETLYLLYVIQWEETNAS